MEQSWKWIRGVITNIVLVVQQTALSVRTNWGIAMLSLVLAVSLWVFVTDRENPDVTDRVPGTITVEAVNLPPGQAVFSIEPEVITVRARASESVFDGLASEDFQATVDLRDVTTQQATVQVRVESNVSRARVEDFSPSQVTVTLENVVSRTVPVVVEDLGGLPRGFALGAVEADVTEAVVTGPERLIADIESIQADVNLTGARSSFEQRVSLQVRSDGGTPFLGIVVEPGSTVVSVEVIQLEFSRTFVVRPVISGLPDDGYNVTGISWDPPIVVVTGPLEILQTIDAVAGIATEVIPIEGANADVIGTRPLQLPQGVVADFAEVTVRVSIAAAQGRVSFDVVPEVTNLESGRNALLSSTTVEVILEGALPDLRSITAADIVAEVDVEGLAPGNYTVVVQIEPPEGLTVVTPVVLTVTINEQ